MSPAGTAESDPLGEYLRPRLQGFRLEGGCGCEARRAAEERAGLAEERLRALEEEMKRLRERPE